MRFTTSRSTERSFMSRPNWQTPGRREFVHGRVHSRFCPRKCVCRKVVG
jgi:hypothetical protein